LESSPESRFLAILSRHNKDMLQPFGLLLERLDLDDNFEQQSNVCQHLDINNLTMCETIDWFHSAKEALRSAYTSGYDITEAAEEFLFARYALRRFLEDIWPGECRH